jgi:hypothetical protein
VTVHDHHRWGYPDLSYTAPNVATCAGCRPSTTAQLSELPPPHPLHSTAVLAAGGRAAIGVSEVSPGVTVTITITITVCVAVHFQVLHWHHLPRWRQLDSSSARLVPHPTRCITLQGTKPSPSWTRETLLLTRLTRGWTGLTLPLW